jgi:hypothetical protein
MSEVEAKAQGARPDHGKAALLRVCAPPTQETTCWPVSARVGNVRNNDRSLIEPIAGAG